MTEKDIIPLARPDIRQEDIDAVVVALQSGMLVQGKNVLALEHDIKSFLKLPHCTALSNGTASLHLALVALGIGPGDEVIVPAFSYVATANVVEIVGATCVFVDVEISTFNISVSQIEKKITPKTKAIIPVHEFGLCADMESIMTIARKHNLFVIEDAACALGATQNGKFSGSSGHFGSFSLHPRKAITSGEGGLLVTSDRQMDHKIRVLRNHGISPDSLPMDFVEAGFNYRMTDFQAALVKSQLARLTNILSYKRKLASIYLAKIDQVRLTLPSMPEGFEHSWQTFHLLMSSNEIRGELMSYLKQKNIYTNYGAQCIPAMTYYQNKYRHDVIKDFPNAWASFTRGIAIPLFERLTESQVEFVAANINDYTKNAKK